MIRQPVERGYLYRLLSHPHTKIGQDCDSGGVLITYTNRDSNGDDIRYTVRLDVEFLDIVHVQKVGDVS